VVVLCGLALDVVVAPAACAQPAESGATTAPADGAGSTHERARPRSAEVDEDEVGAPMAGAWGMGSLFSRGGGLLGTVLLAAAYYFFFVRGQGGGGFGAGWGSYYLFWMVVPALVAVASSHPSLLLLVVVGLVAKPWLPDPFLYFKYSGRIRSLGVEVASNPGNVTARRELAMIWLEKHRPAKALPLLEQALERDPGSHEILFLRGVSQLGVKQPAPAMDSFLAVVHGDPSFRYGEAYLRAADALVELGRNDDAEEALEHYVKKNSSSIEALCKLARVRAARKDVAGAEKARAEAQSVWHLLHGFQRRKQLGWYLRTRLGR
jgi:tetratricopeptide (TPR) repeat protein